MTETTEKTQPIPVTVAAETPKDVARNLGVQAAGLVVGAVTGILTAKLPWLPASIANDIGIAVGSLLTGVTHWVVAQVKAAVAKA